MPLFSRRPSAAPTESAVPATSFAPNVPLDDDERTLSDVWTTAQWVRSLGLHRVIAAALAPPRASADQFEFMSKGMSNDDLRKRLAAAGLAGLHEPIVAGLQNLRQQKAASGSKLTAKFSADGDAFKGEMGFASMDVFFGGEWPSEPACRPRAAHYPMFVCLRTQAWRASSGRRS
jgi:hypothetical protein